MADNETLTDIPKQWIDDFDCKAFEKWLEKTQGKRGRFDEGDMRFQSILYVMNKNSLTSVYQLSTVLFNKHKLVQVYDLVKYDKKLSKMAIDACKSKGINLDIRKYSTKLTKKEREEMFKDAIRVEMTEKYKRDLFDTQTLINIISDILEDFSLNPLEHKININIERGVPIVLRLITKTLYYTLVQLMIWSIDKNNTKNAVQLMDMKVIPRLLPASISI